MTRPERPSRRARSRATPHPSHPLLGSSHATTGSNDALTAVGDVGVWPSDLLRPTSTKHRSSDVPIVPSRSACGVCRGRLACRKPSAFSADRLLQHRPRTSRPDRRRLLHGTPRFRAEGRADPARARPRSRVHVDRRAGACVRHSPADAHRDRRPPRLHRCRWGTDARSRGNRSLRVPQLQRRDRDVSRARIAG